MGWLKSFSDGRGGFDTHEWSVGDVGMDFGVRIVSNLVLVLFFAIFLPIFHLIFYPISNDLDRKWGVITTIISVIYIFIDYSQGWILDYAFNDGGNEDLIQAQVIFLIVNLALVPLNLIIFFFNGFLSKFSPVMFYMFCIVTTYYFWYPLASAIVR